MMATAAIAAALETGKPARFWSIRLAAGLLLGAAVATLNFAHYYPLVPALAGAGPLAFISLLPEWCGEGVILAAIIGLAERMAQPLELRPWQLGLAVAFGSAASVAIWQTFCLFVLHDALGIRLLRDYMGVPVTWIRGVFFHGWLMLFFGGLVGVAYVARQRRARMQAVLLAAEMSRASAQQRLAETRLAAVHLQVAPDFLLDSLARLEALYETDPDAADRLLDELIVFLRSALAGIRALNPSPVLTLPAEGPPGAPPAAHA